MMSIFTIIFSLLTIFVIMGYSWILYKFQQYSNNRTDWQTTIDEVSETIVRGFQIINWCNWIGTIILVCVLY
jgi:hypothetical protein